MDCITRFIAGNKIKIGDLIEMKDGKVCALENIKKPVAIAAENIGTGDTIEIRDGLAYRVPK